MVKHSIPRTVAVTAAQENFVAVRFILRCNRPVFIRNHVAEIPVVIPHDQFQNERGDASGVFDLGRNDIFSNLNQLRYVRVHRCGPFLTAGDLLAVNEYRTDVVTRCFESRRCNARAFKRRGQDIVLIVVLSPDPVRIWPVIERCVVNCNRWFFFWLVFVCAPFDGFLDLGRLPPDGLGRDELIGWILRQYKSTEVIFLFLTVAV